MIKKAIILSTSLLGVASISLTAFAADKAEITQKEESKEVASALDLFPETLYNAKGEKVSRASLKGKIVGIYFSAHWCPPCRAFTPNLVKFRDKHQDDFEIVFVSSDRDEAAQKGYMKETQMKWLAVKFGTKDIKELKGRYELKGIPTLIIVGPDGKTITKDGRGDVTKKPAEALESWQAKAGLKAA
jgi:nucleoredoxin